MKIHQQHQKEHHTIIIEKLRLIYECLWCLPLTQTTWMEIFGINMK